MKNTLTIFVTFFLLLTATAYIQAESEQELLLAPVKTDGKWGFISDDGDFEIPPKFQFANEFSDNLAAVRVDNKWGYIDGLGRYIVEPQFEDAYNFENGLARVRLNNRWGFIDTQGQFVIEPYFEQANDFVEGVALVRINNLYGYVNNKGGYAIEPQFNEAFDFSEGHALVAFNGSWGYINHYNQFTSIPFCEDVASIFSEGLAVIRCNKQFGFINPQGELVITPQYDDARLYAEGYAAVSENGVYGYIDNTGKLAIFPAFQDADYYSERLASVKYNGQYGYINTNGEFIIPPQFDDAQPFQNGLAKIKVHNRYGFINNRGEIVISPEYTYAHDFSAGLVAVQWNNKYGYLSHFGYNVIEPIFEDAGAFKEVIIKASTEKPSITFEVPNVPEVTVNESYIKIAAHIHSKSKIHSYHLFINNQMHDLTESASKGTRIKRLSASDSKNHDISFETNVNLMVGLNEIYVKATNSNGSAESIRLDVNYIPSQMVQKPDLYILTVGISKYEHSQYNINYADDDAKDFASAFMKQKSLPSDLRLFDNITVMRLIDGQATTKNIQDAITNIQQSATKDDLFLLHVSSHGEVDSEGDFYIRTHDTDLGIDNLANTALSNKWVIEKIRNFDCTVIQFFDACHSGLASLDMMSTTDNDKIAMKGMSVARVDIAVRELKDALKSKAVYFFASSSKMQMSQEREAWKNGAFTEALISCFMQHQYTTPDGRVLTADMNQDGFISTTELNIYVPEVVKLITNNQQSPKVTIENGESINLFVLD